MKQIYRLVKLRVETVQAMKNFMGDMGIGSLDQLLCFMINTTRKGRVVLANTGWTTEDGIDEEQSDLGIVHS